MTHVFKSTKNNHLSYDQNKDDNIHKSKALKSVDGEQTNMNTFRVSRL